MKRLIAIALMTLLSCASFAQDAPSFELIPYSPDLKTQKDFDKSFQDFCDRLIGASVAKATDDNAHGERASILAEDCIRHMGHMLDSPTSEAIYTNDASELLFEDRQNPIVDTWLAYVKSITGNRGDAERRINTALAKITQMNPYDPVSEFFARVVLSSIQPNNEANLKAGAEALAKSFESGAIKPQESRIVYAIVDAWLWGISAETLLTTMTNDPRITPWLRKMIECKITLRKMADRKMSRKTPYPPDELKSDNEKLAKATEEAWKANPEFPEPADGILTEPLKGEESKIWFQRAVKAQFDYMPAYYAFKFANSKSPEILAALGRDCVKTGRFETKVPEFYFDCLSGICATLEPNRQMEPFTAPGTRELLLELVKGLEKCDSMSREKKDALLLKAAYGLAWAGEKGKALELLKRISKKTPEPSGLPFRQTPRSVLENALLLEGSPCSELCEKWNGYLNSDKIPETKAMALDIIGKSDSKDLKDQVARGTALLICGIKPSPQLFKLDPLRMAVATKSLAAFEFLKESGWLKDCAPQGSLETALHLASAQRNAQLTSLLLESGAEVSAKDGTGQTALHCAARTKGAGDCIKALLAKGAKPDEIDANGLTPLDLAKKAGIQENIELLSKKDSQ